MRARTGRDPFLGETFRVLKEIFKSSMQKCDTIRPKINFG